MSALKEAADALGDRIFESVLRNDRIEAIHEDLAPDVQDQLSELARLMARAQLERLAGRSPVTVERAAKAVVVNLACAGLNAAADAFGRSLGTLFQEASAQLSQALSQR